MLGKSKKMTPELLRAIGFTGKLSYNDLRTGTILVAVGIAAMVLDT